MTDHMTAPVTAPVLVDTPAALPALTGRDLDSIARPQVSQAMVDTFVALTGDRQWIHTDVARAAREAPGGHTLVPGNLLLSLVPSLIQGAYRVARFSHCVLVGYGAVRFRAPVPPDTPLIATVRIQSVTPVGTRVRVETRCTAILGDGGRAAFSATVTDLYQP